MSTHLTSPLYRQLMPFSVFLASGFQIIMTIQLFNWFSKKVLGSILGCWVAMEFLGLMTKFATLDIFKYFPDFDRAVVESKEPRTLYVNYGILQLVVAGFFIVFVVIDAYFFNFHPFQCAIVVDLEEKTEQDRALLRKLTIESELEKREGQVRSSFGQQYRQDLNNPNRISLNIHNVQMRKQNSYVQIFKVFEFRRVLITSMVYNVATMVLVDDYDYRISTQAMKDKYVSFIIYGTLAGLFTLGAYTDLLARRSLYTLLASLILIDLCIVFVQTIY